MSSLGRGLARAVAAFGALIAACSSPDAKGPLPGAAGMAGMGAGTAGSGGASGTATSGGNGGGPGSGGGAAGGQGGATPTGGTSGAAGSSAGGAAGGGRAGEPGAGSGSGGAAGSAGAPDDEPDGALTAFYLDVGGSVMAVDVATRAVRTVVEDAGQGPDGIAIDEELGHIYWTGMGAPAQNNGFVRRSDLDGSNVAIIVPPGGTYTPKQLRIDPENEKLYWSDREGMRVMRANLDGSEIETLVTTGTTASDRRDSSRWCVGIALDVAGGYVYWSQKGPDNGDVGSIRRAPLAFPAGEDSGSRSDIEVLLAGLPEPIDIDLDLESRTIYWTDRGDDTINRAPIEIPSGETAETRGDREILVRGVREAIGVTLDLERGRLYFTGGTLGRVGSANLDGSDVVDLVTGTAGLTGIVLTELP